MKDKSEKLPILYTADFLIFRLKTAPKVCIKFLGIPIYLLKIRPYVSLTEIQMSGKVISSSADYSIFFRYKYTIYAIKKQTHKWACLVFLSLSKHYENNIIAVCITSNIIFTCIHSCSKICLLICLRTSLNIALNIFAHVVLLASA